MRKFICFTYIVAFTFYSCGMNNKNNPTVKTVCEYYTRTPMYSLSTLQGTKWIADYSNKDKEYHIRFTDSLYICTSVLLGKARDYCYPYYISETPDMKFNNSKVGKEQQGDYIVFYHYNGYRHETLRDEIIFVSPTKLIIVQRGNDTISFTRQ